MIDRKENPPDPGLFETEAEYWRARREWDRTRRERRLAAADPTGWKQHTPYHWSQELNGHRLDYWPSKSKYMYKGVVHVGNVKEFIKRKQK